MTLLEIKIEIKKDDKNKNRMEEDTEKKKKLENVSQDKSSSKQKSTTQVQQGFYQIYKVPLASSEPVCLYPYF